VRALANGWVDGWVDEVPMGEGHPAPTATMTHFPLAGLPHLQQIPSASTKKTRVPGT
jgi:hypothetical protein